MTSKNINGINAGYIVPGIKETDIFRTPMISGQLKMHQLCIYLRESHLDYRDWRGFYFHRFQCNTNFDFKKIEYELKVFFWNFISMDLTKSSNLYFLQKQ